MATGNQQNSLSGRCGHWSSLRKQGSWAHPTAPGKEQGRQGHLGQPQHPHPPGDREKARPGWAWQRPWLGRAGLWELETIPDAAWLGQGLAGLRGSNGVLGCRQGWGSPDRAGKATDALQALTALCLVELLAVTELRMPNLETASASVALIGTNRLILYAFISSLSQPELDSVFSSSEPSGSNFYLIFSICGCYCSKMIICLMCYPVGIGVPPPHAGCLPALWSSACTRQWCRHRSLHPTGLADSEGEFVCQRLLVLAIDLFN